jgi:hypothetical protein
MSYTAPKTWVTDEVVSAADLNTYLRDNDLWVLTDSPTCHVYRSTAQSVTSAGDPSLTFDTERFDNASVHSTSSNTDRLTIPAGGAGKYIVGAVIDWAANTTGYRKLAVKVTGATEIARSVTPTTSTGASAQAIVAVYSMAVADYFTIQVDQNSGGALNVARSANYSPEAYCFWFRT